MNIELREIFSSKKHPLIALSVGLGLTIINKFWKVFVKNIMHITPEKDYMLYEQMNTVFRIGGGAIAIIFCYKLFTHKQLIYKNKLKVLNLNWLMGGICLQRTYIPKSFKTYRP